jgi:hypothetical protein
MPEFHKRYTTSEIEYGVQLSTMQICKSFAPTFITCVLYDILMVIVFAVFFLPWLYVQKYIICSLFSISRKSYLS